MHACEHACVCVHACIVLHRQRTVRMAVIRGLPRTLARVHGHAWACAPTTPLLIAENTSAAAFFSSSVPVTLSCEGQGAHADGNGYKSAHDLEKTIASPLAASRARPTGWYFSASLRYERFI